MFRASFLVLDILLFSIMHLESRTSPFVRIRGIFVINECRKTIENHDIIEDSSFTEMYAEQCTQCRLCGYSNKSKAIFSNNSQLSLESKAREMEFNVVLLHLSLNHHFRNGGWLAYSSFLHSYFRE